MRRRRRLLNVSGQIVRLPLTKGGTIHEHRGIAGERYRNLYSNGALTLRVPIRYGTLDEKHTQTTEWPVRATFELKKDSAVLKFSSDVGGCGLL